MANNTINGGAYSLATGIDPVVDVLLIQQGSVYHTINRNVLMGVTGTPADLTTIQTFQNKVINNTNSITVKDSSLVLQNGSSTTKQAQFSLSGITAGNTRTFSFPDYNATLATIAGTETLTNKTLTSPTINSPNITNASITADSLSGFTTANSGTIYGVAVSLGVITTANSIGSGTVVQGGISGSQLSASAITLGYAQITASFGPTACSTTDVDVTGLSVTVTVPAGGRSIKITCCGGDYEQTGGIGTVYGVIKIKEGSTVLGTTSATPPTANFPNGFTAIAKLTPTAGSHTYKISVANNTTGPNFTIGASATSPTFILVEAV